jgi:L-ascorbate metabolism protein UlaG (beta-lactamase superfamily)
MKILILLSLLFTNVYAKNKIQWLGQAATLITTNEGKKILIDPFIYNNPKTPKKYKDDKFYKDIDLILITHGHGDHVGSLTKIIELSPKSKISMNADLAKVMMNKKQFTNDRYIPLNKSGKINPFDDKTEINMVKAEHSSAVEINGEVHYGGEPVGYVIKFSNGESFYHAGDTGVFGDMKMIGEYYKINTAFIPIGGSYTMGPKEAAYAIDTLLKPKIVVPIHYGTFPALKGTPEEFKKHLKTKKLLKVISPGESVSI